MNKKFLFVILLVISVLPALNLLHSGLPATHDGQDHVARIANFYQSLAEGNLVPRWAGNLNWGYGHPILMFLYPLPSYFASLFHVIGFSLVDSIKLVFGLTYLTGILIFFVWASEQWNPVAGFIGALIYGFSPYRFVDLYVRGDLGEHVAFVFPPLIFWGLLRLSGNKDKLAWLMVSLGIFGLITSHNAIALMVLPVIGVYALYLGIFSTESKQAFWSKTFASVFWGFLLAAFFWVPAFFEGKYTLRDIVTRGSISGRFVSFVQFFYSPWNYGGGNELTKELGLLTWAAIAGALFLLLKLKEKTSKYFIGGSLVLIAASIDLMTSWSLALWDKVSLLQKFQFPWRFLAVPVVVGAMLGSFVGTRINKRFVTPVIVVVILLTVTSTFIMWQPKGYVYYPESYYSGIYNGTTDTGESSPIWSVRFMEHRPAASMQVILGSAEISQFSRTSTRHAYAVNVHQKARILENTLYFPGWKVLVDGQDTAIEFQDPTYRGLITFWVNSGKHSVTAEFTETKLRQLADYLSIFGWTVTVVLLARAIWLKR